MRHIESLQHRSNIEGTGACKPAPSLNDLGSEYFDSEGWGE